MHIVNSCFGVFSICNGLGRAWVKRWVLLLLLLLKILETFTSCIPFQRGAEG